MLFIIIPIVLIFSTWLCYDMHKAPFIDEKEEEYTNDPTTTCWHDDDHHPDSKF